MTAGIASTTNGDSAGYQRADPHGEAGRHAQQALRALSDAGHDLVIVPQCLYEYYVVATRPVEQNGLGLEPDVAVQAIETLLGLFRFCRDERAVFEAWKDLLDRFEIQGKTAHDARLVAAMQRHGITHLLAFNAGDFQRYVPEIQLFAPQDVATGTARF